MSFVGRYADIRKELDYTFHKRYPPDRQLFQDAIVYDEVDEKKKFPSSPDRDSRLSNAVPPNKMIIFTAGAMGSGKTHTLKKMLGTFYREYVHADVDRIKHCLPEMKLLLKTDPENVGTILHSEASSIHEIMFRAAIREGRNVIIDGSLRDGSFFVPLIKKWKRETDYEIFIVHVMATLETCLRRAEQRERITARHVPESFIADSWKESLESVQRLKTFVDHVITVDNDLDDPS
jgi:predicted ABC-type ATPase